MFINAKQYLQLIWLSSSCSTLGVRKSQQHISADSVLQHISADSVLQHISADSVLQHISADSVLRRTKLKLMPELGFLCRIQGLGHLARLDAFRTPMQLLSEYLRTQSPHSTPKCRHDNVANDLNDGDIINL